MANLLNRTDAAALLEVSTQALDRALREGRINYADPAGRLFDRAALVAQWAENRRRRRKPVPAGVGTAPAGSGAPGAVPSEAELRRRLLEAQTTAAEIAVREHARELVDVKAMQREMSARLALLLNALSVIPDRAAVTFGVDEDHRWRLRKGLQEMIDDARQQAVEAGRALQQTPSAK